MKITLFYHSLVSAWNHGNAHFLRGIAMELIRRGHQVTVYEPENGWSLQNLLREQGQAAMNDFRRQFPRLQPAFYDPRNPRLNELLRDSDLVLVHEWNDHDLVRAIGEHRRHHPFTLFFHDTHHRAVSQPAEMARYDLSHYDGVLAFGDSLKQVYERNGWARRVHTWHEAADIHTHRPMGDGIKSGDLVWIGNWGDEERSAELEEFIIRPVKELGLRATFHGVRYPAHALRLLEDAGISYGGYLESHRVAEVFAAHRFTVHVPRRMYTRMLPGIPTIRPFEAMACKIPLLSSPWEDTEGLFTEGRDLRMARDGAHMKELMHWVMDQPREAEAMADHAHATLLSNHTCAHRVDELLQLAASVRQEEHINDRIAS
jgi:spore maturation protein CgeB